MSGLRIVYRNNKIESIKTHCDSNHRSEGLTTFLFNQNDQTFCDYLIFWYCKSCIRWSHKTIGMDNFIDLNSSLQQIKTNRSIERGRVNYFLSVTSFIDTSYELFNLS